MKLFLGADHGGYYLKEKLQAYLTKRGFEWEDVGDKELETEEYNPEGKRIYRPGDKVWLRIQRDALHAVEN